MLHDQMTEQDPAIDISVVIVSFNTKDVLRESLQSVAHETRGLRVETLVVDNASTDGSSEMVEAEFPAVKLFRSTMNLGFGGANNVALTEARGAFIVLLNSDAFLQPHSLELAVERMRQHPECGLGGGLQTNRDGSPQPSAMMFPSVLNDFLVQTGLAWHFAKSKFFGRATRTWADPHEAAQVDWVPGAFMIIRREALQKAGLFDTRFFFYHEEVDLCRRIREAGYNIWYWPDVRIVHLGGESSKKIKTMEMSPYAAQVALWRMRSTLLYYRKHHGMGAWAVKWMEMTLNAIAVLRNSVSNAPERKARGRQMKRMNELMQQAWSETRGGRVSPPTPW